MTYFIRFMDNGKILLRCNELSEAVLLSSVDEIPSQLKKFIAKLNPPSEEQKKKP